MEDYIEMNKQEMTDISVIDVESTVIITEKLPEILSATSVVLELRLHDCSLVS